MTATRSRAALRFFVVLAMLGMIAALVALKLNQSSCMTDACLVGDYYLDTASQKVILILRDNHSWRYLSGDAKYAGSWSASKEDAEAVRIVFDNFPTSLPDDATTQPALGVFAPLFEPYGSGLRACLDGGRRCLVSASAGGTR